MDEEGATAVPITFPLLEDSGRNVYFYPRNERRRTAAIIRRSKRMNKRKEG